VSKSNGQREKALEARQEMEKDKMAEQHELSKEKAGLQNALNSQGDVSEGLIRELVSDSDIDIGEGEHEQTRTVAKLQNLLARDWVLSNLTEAQEHDARYKLEVLRVKITGIHPPEGGITGPTRAFLMDNPEEELEPLTQQERLLIDELIETLKTRFARSRGGFEREQQNTDIARTETGETGEDDATSWGLFS
jgi:hypothetical protein